MGREATLHDGRRLRALAACAAAIAAVLLGGCGAGTPSGTGAHAARTTAVDAAAQARLMRAGRNVFAEHCQTCHPFLGKPNTHVHTDAPPYDLDEVKVPAASIRHWLLQGDPGMGTLTQELSARELQAVVAYVAAVGGRDVRRPGDVDAGRLATGRDVFQQHCQSCHQIGGQPPTHPIWWLGANFDVIQPSERWVAKRVREGQDVAMPSFRRRLTADQIAAVAAYVAVTARLDHADG